MISTNLMNFDTRTVLDLISLDTTLREDIESILIQEERLLKKNKKEFSYDSTYPEIEECIKLFLRKDLKRVGLPILKGSINLNNVSYKDIIDSIRNIK